jgi:uncharacterized protein YbjT (DUF2867 family)
MILVVGGTGSLGGRVATGLLRAGEDVRVLVRPGSAYGRLADAGAEVVFGDLREPDTLAVACDGVDVVVTTANSAKSGSDDALEAVDRVGNRALIDAAREASVARFIFVSALGADPESPVPFLRAKGETEAYLRSSGLEHTIICPNIFMDTWFPTLVEGPLAAEQPVSLVGEASRRHSFVAEEDVARFILAAVRHPAARNTTVVVGGPDPLSWRDVVRIYEDATGRSIQLRFVAPGEVLPGLPEIVAQLAAGFETYDSPIPMDEACATFDIRLTPATRFVRDRAPGGWARA